MKTNSVENSLFIIPTPIGNLKDITLRALEILKSVDFILCEDTRVVKVLLNEYEIRSELISFNAQSEERKIAKVIERLRSGESGALVSDAGTPTISDPGARLINAVRQNDLKVVGLPGANAAILALSMSGLPSVSFVFEGFPPQKKGRQKLLKELSEEKRTIILYESVYRIEKLLNELNEYMPHRLVMVFRELTKKFEEVWKGRPSELMEDLPNKTIKGEFVVVIAPINWKY